MAAAEQRDEEQLHRVLLADHHAAHVLLQCAYDAPRFLHKTISPILYVLFREKPAVRNCRPFIRGRTRCGAADILIDTVYRIIALITSMVQKNLNYAVEY